ncbi:MAG: hypothetical protein L0Y44_10100 [Phycisphaerales bacterium]|nr:hypothetical protein [Phycisphaerales bacterium]MCI0630988.1 hypothetical protein [Phycisphaerales bacterium]MCI0676768.1 hypothetical protein [Phycisphaerales bacterium]
MTIKLMFLMAFACGCGSSGINRPTGRPLALGEFASDALVSGRRNPVPAPLAPPAEPGLTVAEGEPRDQGREGSVETGKPVIIESLVGQVSGRPIFADSLLEPIADQLRRESERLTTQQFVQQAAQIVNARLNEVVLSELFLAEAQAALTPQQQQGLLAFLKAFRERTLAEGFGSLSQRERELQQEQGISVDEYVELERNRVLIANLINEKIEPRVIVSWKDVQREYERRKAEFNPPAKVTLRRIRLSNDQPQEIERVKSRLAAGDDFASVAESAGESNGGLWDADFPIGPGGISDIDINEAYKPYLSGLSAGQTTEAIEHDGRTIWLHIDKIDQPAPRGLYDLQRQLAEELYFRRRAEQRDRYIKSLFDKGIYSELEEMSRRVLLVALMRYGRG